MPDKPKDPCVCCGKAAAYSIILAVGPNNAPNKLPRFYLPNQHVRNPPVGPSPGEEVAFCQACMRTVEDNLRATMLYLQSEADRLSIREAKPQAT